MEIHLTVFHAGHAEIDIGRVTRLDGDIDHERPANGIQLTNCHHPGQFGRHQEMGFVHRKRGQDVGCFTRPVRIFIGYQFNGPVVLVGKVGPFILAVCHPEIARIGDKLLSTFMNDCLDFKAANHRH